MADMARHFFNKVADCAALFNADHLQFLGHGLLIVFDKNADTRSMHHASRAKKLMQSMGAIRTSMQSYVNQQLSGVNPEQALPVFSCSIALHVGHLSIGKMDGLAGGIEQLVPVGQDMQYLTALLQAGQALRWHTLFSEAALDHWTKLKIKPEIAEQSETKIGAQMMRIHRGA